MTGYLSKFIDQFATLTAPLRNLIHKDVRFRWTETEACAFQTLKAAITSEQKMAFPKPKLLITVSTEASFNEGLSANLFQLYKQARRAT